MSLPDSDITGQTFGSLKAVRKTKPRHWQFLCSCGRSVELKKWNVVSGHTTSCGCGRRTKLTRIAIPLWNDSTLTLDDLSRYHELATRNVAQWKAEVYIKPTTFATERLRRAEKLALQIKDQMNLSQLEKELL